VLELLPAWACCASVPKPRDAWTGFWKRAREPARLLAARDNGPVPAHQVGIAADRRQLETLRRLCEWREQRARQADKPRGWVVEDSALVAIARDMPGE
jgi:ribonuclease D